MKYLFALLLLVTQSVFGAVLSRGEGGVSLTGLGIYSTNICVQGGQDTNQIILSGAGDSAVNTTFYFKSQTSSPYYNAVWTNVGDTRAIWYEPGIHIYFNEWTVTNTAGSTLYDKSGSSPVGAWGNAGGAGPNPSGAYGFNTNCYTFYFPLSSNVPYTTTYGSNVLYVNSAVSPGDNFAIVGRQDYPWATINGALNRASSNQTVIVFPGVYPETSSGFTVPNNVTLLGFGSQNTLVGTSGIEMPIVLKTNSVMQDIGGYASIGMYSHGGRLSSCNLTGNIDCLFIGTAGAVPTNIVVEGNTLAVVASDVSNPLIDAGVIANGSSVLRNNTFVSRKTGASGTSTRRGIAIKGGTIWIQGGLITAKDATDTYGIHFTGDAAATCYIAPDVQFEVNTTNGAAICISNSAAGTPATVVLSGPIPCQPNQAWGTIRWTNVTAEPIAFLTNQNQIRPDFALPIQLMQTNASFTFLAPNGVDSTKKVWQQSVIYVTNGANAILTATAPANCRSFGTMTIAAQGLTKYIFEVYPTVGTNVEGKPVY